MKNFSIQNLLDWLETRGLLQQRPQAEAFLLAQPNQMPSIALQLLMLVGALLGSACFISFLFATNIIHVYQINALMILGGILVFLGITLSHLRLFSIALPINLLLQSSLLFIISGKVLFLTGFVQLHLPYEITDLSHYIESLGTAHSEFMLSLGLILSTLATYPLFNLQVERFLSTLFVILSILANVLFHFNTDIPFFIYYCSLLITTLLLFLWKDKSYHWVPCSYACAVALILSTFVIPATLHMGFSHFMKINISTFYYSLLLAGGLVAMCLYLFGWKTSKSIPVYSACIALLCLTFFTHAGILLSMGLLLLGYGQREKPLTILGAVFFVLFIVDYYYSLSMSLAHKSLYLMASGAALLTAYQIMRYFHWDDER